ncbi:MAG: hypothetical protein WD052_01645 [Bacteroidales bacterium]
MHLRTIILIGTVFFLFTGCTAVNKSMREPNSRLELELSDFTLSEQVAAEATSTKIVGIDWQRLFKQETGTVQGSSSIQINAANIPVIGNYLVDQTANYALYELMVNNPNYDVVIYPQYETTIEKPILGIGFIIKTTTVKTTARLGKLKSE